MVPPQASLLALFSGLSVLTNTGASSANSPDGPAQDSQYRPVPRFLLSALLGVGDLRVNFQADDTQFMISGHRRIEAAF